MSIYNIPNISDGMDNAIIDTVTAVPSFIPMLLIFVFSIIFIGGIIAQKRRLGSADIPMWATMAGIGTLLVSLPLTLTSGLIQAEVLSIVVVITIFAGLWLFLDRNRNEV